MPYCAGILYRDGEPIVCDSGDYPGGLQKALDAAGGIAAFRRHQREARRQGRYLGLRIGCYVEGTAVGRSNVRPSGVAQQSSAAVGRSNVRPSGVAQQSSGLAA